MSENKYFDKEEFFKKKKSFNFSVEFDFLVDEMPEAIQHLQNNLEVRRPGVKCFITNNQTGEQFMYNFDDKQITDMGKRSNSLSDLPASANGVQDLW
ncbi:MAG: hypothetical protein ABI954_15755 [Pyrinomonadaceae bacterium]